MKQTILILLLIALIAAVSVGLGWTAHQATAAAEPPLSRYVPSGSLLYLQAKDFSSLTRRLEPITAKGGMAGEQQL